ncbi:MAG: DUF6049 family protein [Acidimicrobiia bacterium]|nr:DUF6049 family protein [Acidimicrobiia bacterium]
MRTGSSSAPRPWGPSTPASPPARPFLLESGQRLFLSAASDEGLSSLLTGGGEPALDAQRLLAGLALVALEEPSVRRGVVVHTPERWDPPTDLLAALVAGLRGHPLLEPVGIDSLLDDVPVSESDGGGPLVRQLTPVTPGDVAVTAEALAEARRDLDSFRTFVPDDDPRVVRGERALRVVPSSAWAGPAGRARVAAELQMTEDAITELLAGIRAPDGRRVTLTARRAEIPVAFRNETGQTVTVRVVLQSDKLFFPEGAAHVVELPPRTTTVRFSVETRASGTFPLLLTVTATDGHLIVQRARLTIRSTVVSGVGLFLTVGAGLFLVGWWLTHWGRSRRDRRARPAPDGAGGGPGDPGPPGTGSEPVT